MIIAGSSQQRKRGIFILKKLAMPGIRSSELVCKQKAEAWILQKRIMGIDMRFWISDAQKSFLWSRCNQSQGDFKLAHYCGFLYSNRPCHVFVAQLLLEAVGCFTAQAECQSRAASAGEADPWRTIPSCAREKGWVGRQRSCRGRIYKNIYDRFQKKELIENIFIRRSDGIQESKKRIQLISLWWKKESLMLKEIARNACY